MPKETKKKKNDDNAFKDNQAEMVSRLITENAKLKGMLIGARSKNKKSQTKTQSTTKIAGLQGLGSKPKLPR